MIFSMLSIFKMLSFLVYDQNFYGGGGVGVVDGEAVTVKDA